MQRSSLTIALLILASLAQAQTTSLRQQQIQEGDIAELVIEYEASIPSLYAIDTAPLEKDFKILGTQSNVSRVTRENRTMHRTHWSVTMVPRRSGKLEIPALRFGEHYSEPLWLQVAARDPGIPAPQDAFFDLQILPENPYPGEQTRLVLRLYHNLSSLEGQIQDPVIENARVFRSGRDQRYVEQRGGEQFTVHERSILLLPETAGFLSVGAASYRGVISPAGETGDALGTELSRYIYRESESFQLELRSLPPAFDGESWLPARDLQVTLSPDNVPQPAMVGDSIGVTLTLQAVGLAAEKLPADLLLHESEQYRIYADQALRSTEVAGPPGKTRLIGRLEQRYAILLDQPGRLSLPQFQLGWWDVIQDRARIATVDTDAVIVVAIARDANAGEDGSLFQKDFGRPGSWQIQPLLQDWPFYAAGALLLLIAGLVTAARRTRQRLMDKLADWRLKRHYRQELGRACHEGNAVAAHRALIYWSRLHWKNPAIIGLHSIAGQASSRDWQDQLQQLDAAQFSRSSKDWQGGALWQLVRLEENQKQERASGRPGQLPGLYPRQT